MVFGLCDLPLEPTFAERMATVGRPTFAERMATVGRPTFAERKAPADRRAHEMPMKENHIARAIKTGQIEIRNAFVGIQHLNRFSNNAQTDAPFLCLRTKDAFLYSTA